MPFEILTSLFIHWIAHVRGGRHFAVPPVLTNAIKIKLNNSSELVKTGELT